MLAANFFSGGKCKQALAFWVPSLVLLMLAGCKPAAQQAPPAPPTMSVKVSHPLAKEIVDYDEFTARLSAVNSVEIRARVNGYLDKVNFTDGALVKKGDLLFVIDPRPYQADLDRAKASLETAKTQMALADNDNKRALELMQSKAISAEEFDRRSKALAVASAAVRIADANVETSQLNLAYTSILAPIDGRLGRALITEGNLVTGDAKDATLLTTLVSVDPIYAYIDVDEATVLKYQDLDRQGLRKNNNGHIPIDLALGNSETFAYKGSIDFIDNQIDSTTGTLHARAVIPNPDRNLIPGAFARMRVTGSGKYTGMLIPDFAISTDQDKKIVYVVGADKMIQTREVTPGRLMNGLRVIRSGLDETDLVVLDHLQMIRPGMPVSPQEEPLHENTGEAADASVTSPVHP